MSVIGDREMENGEVAVRSRREGDKGAMKLCDLLPALEKEIADKVIG
jgi:threonyl-tRNA synthetase